MAASSKTTATGRHSSSALRSGSGAVVVSAGEVSMTRSVVARGLEVIDYDARHEICRHGLRVRVRTDFSETRMLDYRHEPDDLYWGFAIAGTVVSDPGFGPVAWVVSRDRPGPVAWVVSRDRPAPW